MIIKPVRLGCESLPEQELKKDRKYCKKFGPCGVGEQALYLNSFYIDRRYYIPFTSVTRIYKRVAMSKGGFTGKGLFASIPYLVVEYGDGNEKQCNFKYEENVDRMLSYIGREHPDIKLVSKAAEERLRRREQERAARRLPTLSAEAGREVERLENAGQFLQEKPELCGALSRSARRKRAYDNSSPTYKWVALSVSLLGICSLVYGVYLLIHRAEFAIYFTLFGMAAIFLFSSASILPTSGNNRRYVENQVRRAMEEMEQYLSGYGLTACGIDNMGESDKGTGGEQRESGWVSGFPTPVRYSHPIVLKRMADAIREGRAETAEAALQLVKADLKSLNSDVEVDQEEYEEVVAIKALFLNEGYR